MTVDSRTRVLVFIGAYLPGFKGGGPVTSIRNLVDRLSDEIAFRVVAPDRDLFSETAYPDMPVREWTQLGKEKVLYLPPTPLNVLDVLTTLRLTPHDVVYLNSFFSPRYTIPVLILRRLGLIPRRPVVLAVRGEFAPAALALKSKKKQAYLKLAQKIGLLRNVIFHATNPIEEDRIRTVLGPNVRTHLAPPLARVPNPVEREVKSGSGPLQLVFLGRVAPMKNLDYALEVLAEVSIPTEFTIYGPLEDEQYWKLCQGLIAKLPAHINVKYGGSLDPAEVPETLGQYDLLFLPTRGENFGHVIAEALAAGCPVLISDQTPWQDLEENKCGWTLPLEDRTRFVETIVKIGTMSTQDLQSISLGAVNYIMDKEHKSNKVKLSRYLFQKFDKGEDLSMIRKL